MNKPKFYFVLFMFCIVPYCIKAQNMNIEVEQLQLKVTTLSNEVLLLKDSQKDMRASLNELQFIQKRHLNRISSLEKENNNLREIIDSIKAGYSILSRNQRQDKEHLATQISYTKEEIKMNQDLLSNRTNVGSILFAFIIIVIIAIVITFFMKFKKGINSIEEVRKVQSTLDKAQKSLQEESIKLDNKLLEVTERYLSSMGNSRDILSDKTKIDHSLALKVADEIIRIELNLSRMDSSIKGYKQLAKAVQRIKDNFQANGYEIIDMLGKPYVAGMKAAVTFVTDESLEKGQQIISKIIKPQINYQQQMIQAAEIEVSQSG